MTLTETSSTKCMAGYCDVPVARGLPCIPFTTPMAAGQGEDRRSAGRAASSRAFRRKAIELRGAIALLTATPTAEGPREDMRRRLHTLYASAVVFRNEPLYRRSRTASSVWMPLERSPGPERQ